MVEQVKGDTEMSISYQVIEVFTSEEAKFKGHPLYISLVQRIRDLHIAARCIVLRGIAGCYESGEIATHGIEVLSFHMPLKIEIVLPAFELERVLPMVEEMVGDGIILVKEMSMQVHRVSARLLPRNLRVADIMTRDPQSVSSDTSVAEVVKLMLSGTFNAVPVVDINRKPLGIITQGDLIKRAGMPVRLGLLREMKEEHQDATREELAKKKAVHIMTSPVVTVTEDLAIPHAVKVMIEKNLKRLPVTNKHGVLTGNLSRFDVFHTITHHTTEWRTIESQDVEVIGKIRRIGEVVRRDVRAVRPETPLDEVMQIIDENDIQRVMVVDDSGTLIGMIFDKDLLDLFSGHHIGLWDRIASRFTFTELGQKHKQVLENARKKTAQDVMKQELVTVDEETTLDDAIRLMTARQIKLLPVVAKDGRLIGVVTRKMLLSLPFRSENWDTGINNVWSG
jgi:CBS domain-containing protein